MSVVLGPGNRREYQARFRVCPFAPTQYIYSSIAPWFSLKSGIHVQLSSLPHITERVSSLGRRGDHTRTNSPHTLLFSRFAECISGILGIQCCLPSMHFFGTRYTMSFAEWPVFWHVAKCRYVVVLIPSLLRGQPSSCPLTIDQRAGSRTVVADD